MLIDIFQFLQDNPGYILWALSQVSGWLRLYVAHRLKMAEQRRPANPGGKD
jgi:hypothetical protein